MNQILSVGNQNKKNKSSIHSIIVVFAIILMIFGIGLTSTGAYSYYKNLSSNLKNNIVTEASTKPIITLERQSASRMNIVVTHDKEIVNVIYTINDNEAVEVSGNGKKEVQTEVELPVGTSTITITAEDIQGIKSSYTTSLEVAQRPNIELEQVNTQIQVTTTSSINIDTIKYYWDDDVQNAVNQTINDSQNVTLIDVLAGTHTLTIIATDIEGNESTTTKKIVGDTKPQLDVVTNGEVFIIKATDDESLSKIEITLNTNETITETITGTEYSTTIELEQGENRLTVKVENANGLSEIARVKYTKE